MTNFAKSISTTPIEAISPRQSFNEVKRADAEVIEPRNSEMIAKEQPKPTLHPSPALSFGSDGAVFNAAWEREQRRAAFIRERTDPESGGRVRVLNRDFNR
ncbi:hypothetical protein [Thalassospira alkalitolerans]|uniref:Uncharacterized protein n=1 Tax=Thalassospira alkalitolerans TaxID=1293890 RepID=A0A1Y2L9R8_9PROT|nr:hypothetical protein [Thalassospira alkalitolerans]OSQ47044.1 hypothetical protein TALK_13515 [Thalassospira alkalitolerans]